MLHRSAGQQEWLGSLLPMSSPQLCVKPQCSLLSASHSSTATFLCSSARNRRSLSLPCKTRRMNNQPRWLSAQMCSCLSSGSLIIASSICTTHCITAQQEKPYWGCAANSHCQTSQCSNWTPHEQAAGSWRQGLCRSGWRASLAYLGPIKLHRCTAPIDGHINKALQATQH